MVPPLQLEGVGGEPRPRHQGGAAGPGLLARPAPAEDQPGLAVAPPALGQAGQPAAGPVPVQELHSQAGVSPGVLDPVPTRHQESLLWWRRCCC